LINQRVLPYPFLSLHQLVVVVEFI